MELTKEIQKMILVFVKKFLKNYVPPRYLNQKQAVSYTGTSPGTINDWVRHRGLRIIILEENANPKYDMKDLDAFMEKYKTKEVVPNDYF